MNEKNKIMIKKLSLQMYDKLYSRKTVDASLEISWIEHVIEHAMRYDFKNITPGKRFRIDHYYDKPDKPDTLRYLRSLKDALTTERGGGVRDFFTSDQISDIHRVLKCLYIIRFNLEKKWEANICDPTCS